jgi:FMN reductase (NADPH)
MRRDFDTPLMEAMRRHRSIRRYRPDPLPAGMLDAIISCAQMASTSAYLQQYSVVAVEDKSRKDRLAGLCGDQEQIRQCPVFLAFCADLHRLKRVCEREGTQIQTEYVEAFLTAAMDAALLAQNVALAAESLGLGIVYIGAIRNSPAEIVAELALPDLVFPVTGMCLGYPAESPKAKPRLPLPAVLHRERYQQEEIDAHLEAYDAEIVGREMFRHMETGEVYGWMARAARRMAYSDPKRLRVDVGRVLRQQGFGLR